MASEEETYGTIALRGTPVTELRVTDIKRELEKRGLSKTGSKTQLTDRLKAQLLLEKLQQDAAQSSGDELEGKAPNIALQQDDKAGQSEFVRQYLQQQQRNLEIQMEMKKQVEEERNRLSADESSAEESGSPNIRCQVVQNPDVTSLRKFKDGTSNAPAKEGAKMSKPARKSSRNSSKGENGQEGEHVKVRLELPERGRESSPSGSSSSSRSPSAEKSSQSRRGRSSRGRAKRGGGRQGGQQGISRSSSPASSPEEVMSKKKHRPRTNSSSHSRSRSPQIVSSETPTRRSSRRSHTGPKSAPDHVQEPQDGGGDKAGEKPENAEEYLPSSTKRKWRKKPSSSVRTDSTETNQTKEDSSKSSSVSALPLAGGGRDQGLQKASADIEMESSGTEPLRQAKSASKGETTKVEVKLSGGTGRQSASRVHQGQGTVTVGNVHISRLPQQNEPTSDIAKESISSEPAPLLPINKSAVAELENNKLASEEKNNPANYQHLSKKKIEHAETSVDEEAVKKDSPSPYSARVQRHGSYSGDSSSVESKSPVTKTRSRSSSSGSDSQSNSRSSSSTSTDASPTKTKSQAHTHVKQDNSLRQSSLSPVHAGRVQMGSAKRLVAVPRKGGPDREASSSPGEPKFRNQLEIGSLPDKEQESKSEGAKGKQDRTPGDQDDASRDHASNADADEEAVTKKGTKKRKWGSKTSKAGKTSKRTTSIEISSDVLKNLIGDVKLTETVFEMETEMVNTLDYDEHEEDRRDVKVKRNVSQSPLTEVMTEPEDARRVETRGSPQPMHIPVEPEKKIIKLSNAAPKVGGKTKLKHAKKSKDGKKKGHVAEKENKEDAITEKESKERVFATTRSIKPLLPVVDEPEPVSSSQSPARNPADRVIRIAGLVRPFTVGQLKELLRRTGELDEEYFWISAIKSHCLAAYKTQEEAVLTRAALHGTRWPQSNPKILIVDFATVEDVIHRKTEGDVPLPALIKKPEEHNKLKELKIDEEREKKQKGREHREKGKVERQKEERDKRDSRDQKREPGKRKPIREWDRDKIQQLSRSRSKSKEKERVARRTRSRDRDQRKKRGHSKDKKEEDRRREKKQKDAKAEEEPPAKLLDDLFRKTKATPCIYWLPLTEDQAQQRVLKKLELEKERLKRIAAAEEREKEELRKRETARLERQREREKARDKSRERDRNRQEKSRSSKSQSRSRSRRRR